MNLNLTSKLPLARHLMAVASFMEAPKPLLPAKPRQRKTWTQAETDLLELLIEDGLTPAQMAAELGRTADACRVQCCVMRRGRR